MSATAALLDVIIGKARALREAGVLRVQLDGLAFDMAPVEPQMEQGEDDGQPDEDSDPWNDRATYGGRVPGLRRRPPEEHQR